MAGKKAMKKRGQHGADPNQAGVATAADVTLAANQPATTRNVRPDISIAIVNLLRDPELQAALEEHADAIAEHDDGDVPGTLEQISGFVDAFDAHARMSISLARLHETLVRMNAAFGSFLTAVAGAYGGAGPKAAIRASKPIRKLVKSRLVQRGVPKAIAKKKRKAKKKAV